jgi:DNA adenine methylase
MENKIARPFLKWAGGKSQLLKEISLKFPFSKDDSFSYIEPFVGSGAVLFWVLNNYPMLDKIVVNDINKDLMDSYKTIKKDVEKLINILKEYEKEYFSLSDNDEKKKEYYYEKRNLFNKRVSSKTVQTALLIFLNKTCFNGLYRVNKKNEFNVPIGSYKKPLICDESNLRSVSRALENVVLLNSDFEKTLKYADQNCLFYFDPPYKPLSPTSSFNSYSKAQFDDLEQIRLKKFCDKLSQTGCRWILSNSDVKGKNPEDNFFDELFNKYQINRVPAKRFINSDPAKRGELTELLITDK